MKLILRFLIENCNREQRVVKKDYLNVILAKKTAECHLWCGTPLVLEKIGGWRLASDHVGNLKSDFQALFGIKPWVTGGQVIVG